MEINKSKKQRNKRMNRNFFFVIIISVLNLQCANRTYTPKQGYGALCQDLEGKFVEVSLQGDKKLMGYFHCANEDSVTIRAMPEAIKEQKIALKDIKTVKVKKKENPAIAVG
ncbi:MAG: hypothetical protein D6813_15840, partial [Calditrichaeota bacterium]